MFRRLVAIVAAICAANAILVWDHFERLADAVVISSAIVVLAAAALIIWLEHAKASETARAESAEQIGAARGRDADRLAAVVRSSHEAVLSIDLDGRVTSWNRGAERIYGYRAKEAVGRRLVDLVVPDERLNEPHEIIAGVRDGRPTRLQTRRYTKDGRLLEISLRAFPVIGSGDRVSGATIVAQDVTTPQEREVEERAATERLRWRRQIGRALDSGEFVFHGQPVIDARTGTHSHHELLIRLCREGELILPGRFLSHAESSELIERIDRAAVNHAIACARRTPVAVNLSARSLGSEKLLPFVAAAIARTRPAHRLTFEITETAAVENLEIAADLVAGLTALGCCVALDDFGTGYGSFNYLKRLPATHLKIDMEFVRGLGSDPTDERVVSTIVSMAHHFGLKTVAEGVESGETLDLVRQMGVDLAQGFYIGRPAPLELDTVGDRGAMTSSAAAHPDRRPAAADDGSA